MTSINPSSLPGAADQQPIASLRDLRHQIGNALTPALGHVQRLQRALPSWAGDEDRETLHLIRESIARAVRLLETAAAHHADRCNLVTALASALASLPKDRFPDANVRIDTPLPLVGFWSEQYVVQILASLLSNAAKYSPAGTPIEVILDARLPANAGSAGDVGEVGATGLATVLVQHYGIGVPPEDAERIFQGHRTDSARPCAGGGGSGLRLSHRYAESVGGHLWTERRGAATTFILQLPLHAA